MGNGYFLNLWQNLVPALQEAGLRQMDIYQSGFLVEKKSDDSPVTQADRVAESLILAALAKIAPDIPVVAEEAASEGKIPAINDRFFLVDPLDGTKEFIKKSDEFTINIGLIENGIPVFGIVFAPATKELYLTLSPQRAAMTKMDPENKNISAGDLKLEDIKIRQPEKHGLAVVASKSHMTDETQKYIERYQVANIKNAGSSLKFCLLAKGEADLYPRFGPTMEWDTAAGHAILRAAGGEVVNHDNSKFKYGKIEQNFLNGPFIARSDEKLIAQFQIDASEHA